MEEIIASQFASFRASLLPQVAVAPAPLVPEARQEHRLFEIDGKFRRAPHDFDFPKGRLQFFGFFCFLSFFSFFFFSCSLFCCLTVVAVPADTMFARWCTGDKERGIGPFKNFERSDMPTPGTKKRLSDVNNLMGRLEKKLKAEQKWVANPTMAQVNEMYSSAADVLEVAVLTPTGRKRRLDQLKWNTHYDLLHKEAKPH